MHETAWARGIRFLDTLAVGSRMADSGAQHGITAGVFMPESGMTVRFEICQLFRQASRSCSMEIGVTGLLKAGSIYAD